MGSAGRSGRPELDDLVVNTELTLISIIQGIALFFLVETAHEAFREGDLRALPYVANGLVLILVFWSRSIMHTFTIIGWPLEFEHNFLYVGCTLVESMMIAESRAPRYWWPLHTLFLLGCWYLFWSDSRMIGKRLAEAPGDASRELFGEIARDQRLQMRLVMPVLVTVAVAGSVAAWRHEGAELFVAWALVPSFLAYLAAGCRQFRRLVPSLERARRERAAGG